MRDLFLQCTCVCTLVMLRNIPQQGTKSEDVEVGMCFLVLIKEAWWITLAHYYMQSNPSIATNNLRLLESLKLSKRHQQKKLINACHLALDIFNLPGEANTDKTI